MMYVIGVHSSVPILRTVALGILVSIPLLRSRVYVFDRSGIWGALGFCVATDLLSAFAMKDSSLSAGIETFVIFLFVIMGVKRES